MTIKTYDAWGVSRQNLSEFLQIGDMVDGEMVDYFINVLPPATMTRDIVQMGEPYSHVQGRATYATLKNTGNGWSYCGHCHRGETEHVTGYVRSANVGIVYADGCTVCEDCARERFYNGQFSDDTTLTEEGATCDDCGRVITEVHAANDAAK